MDWETLVNTTVLCVEHFSLPIKKSFVIGKTRNDIKELNKFLTECKKNKEWHIGYNSLVFDSQITEYFLMNQKGFEEGDPEMVANLVYLKAQDIINRQDQGEFPEWSERNLSIKAIDVFKMNHWDSPAKRSGLKWIQFSMDWHNLKEMPIHHSKVINTKEEVDDIVSYCYNDVSSTKNILHISKEQLSLRKALTKEYDINLFNASEPRISKELFLHFLSKETGINKWELKSLRTRRDFIHLKDVILPYIKFEKEEFKNILSKFNQVVVDSRDMKGGFKYSITHKDVKTDFGLGGLHGVRRAGEYEAKDGMIIMTSDVVSFYPRLIITNGWAPAHLPKEIFCQLYQWFFEERQKISKKDPRNYVYKIILNSTYGLSNEENSFLYDPELTLKVTINGQLSLAMLYEMISTGIPGSIPLMQNTDGLETIIPAQYKEKYLEICKEWQRITGLELEHDEYQKMFIADVNSYLGVSKYKEVKEDKEKGKSAKEVWDELGAEKPQYLFKEEDGKYFYASTKCKGRLEWEDQEAKKANILHKNKSFLIVAKAVYHYFVHDMLPEKYLADNRNIFDYCGGAKIKGEWEFKEQCFIEGKFTYNKLQNTVRYYVSNEGCKIIKVNKLNGKEINLVSGKWQQTVFNQYEEKPWSEYRVDDNFYLDRIYSEIENIRSLKTKNQLTLF